MKTQKKLITTILCTTVVLNIVPTNTSAKAEVKIEDKTRFIATAIPKFSENGKPRALDLYWHRMAQCETGGDWKNKGRWSGGLGIYTQTWYGYGGREFAKKPELATIEEQIIVANRISTQGYQTKNEFLTLEDRQKNRPFFRPPVGFGGWGCKKSVGKPMLFKKFPAKVLFREYKLGEKGNHVRKIQEIIGTGVDGYFGPVTDKYYNKFFTKYRSIIMAEYKKYHPDK